jgi:type II secretory ATPase GspE/PulE/Tfp pilus assembly ATPase PilB-like protein
MERSYIQTIVAYLKGELEGEEKERFEQDLARSPRLQTELEQHRQVLDLLEAACEKRIIEIVHIGMIQRAIREGASDIHFVPGRHKEPGEEGRDVLYFRIHGRLHEVERYPEELYRAIVDRWKLMSECNLSERQLPQEGRIAVRYQGKDYDLRVIILPALRGERVTAHLLAKASLPADLDSMGFAAPQLESVRRLLQRPSGLVAVAGPAGSGKSTLLYMLLREIQAQDPNGTSILTIEDPVEYSIDGDLVSQIAIHRRAGLTFASGLRSALRSDPDVVFVGELPDRETAALALHAAMTGRRVLTALSANSALSGIELLKEMELDPAGIAQSLAGVIGLRLVRKPCPECVSEYAPDATELQWLGLSHAAEPFRRGLGCEACRQTGYSGRVALFEVLELDDALRRRIVEGAPMETLWWEAFGRRGGSLRDDAREKVRQGLTTVEEATRALFDYPFPGAGSGTVG